MKSRNPQLTQSYVMMCLFMRKKIQWKRQMSQSAYTGVFSAFLFWFLCIFTVTVCFLDLKKRELHWETHTHGRKLTDELLKNKKKQIWLNRLRRLLFLSLPEDSSHQPSFLLNKNRRLNVQLTKRKQKWNYCSLRIHYDEFCYNKTVKSVFLCRLQLEFSPCCKTKWCLKILAEANEQTWSSTFKVWRSDFFSSLDECTHQQQASCGCKLATNARSEKLLVLYCTIQ